MGGGTISKTLISIGSLLLLTSCDEPAPGIVQLKCMPVLKASHDGSAFLKLDFGRRTAVRVDGANHGPMSLGSSDFYLSFADPGGHKITINRYTGSMTYEPAPLKARLPPQKEAWQCTRQQRGRLF